MSALRRVGACALVLVLAGCGSTATFRFVTGPVGAPRNVDPQVYLETANPPPGYTEVAVLQAVGRGNQADDEHVIEGLRAQAATLGCDAVIRVHIDPGDTLRSGVGVGVRWLHGVPLNSSTVPSLPTPWSQPAASPPPWSTTPR